MFCNKCGNQAVEGAAFCNKCGKKFIVEGVAQQTPVESTPQQPKATKTTASYQPPQTPPVEAKTGVVDKALDFAFKKVGLSDTARMAPEHFAEMVNKIFIIGADNEYLDLVEKALTPGTFKCPTVTSKDGAYLLRADKRNGAFPPPKKTLWIKELQGKRIYEIDKEKNYKTTKSLIMQYIEQAKR